MRKKIGMMLLVFVFCSASSLTLVSCKSKKAVIAEGTASKMLTADKIIANHYNNKKDFSTLYIKSSASYKDDKQTQNVTAEIKIKKDEKILVSIRFLGITMAKALITPNEVKYYEKINGEYFEGNYAGLSQWLGTDLDFQKVQNMLIGQAFDDLNKGKYKTTIEDKLYKLENTSDANTNKAFYFEAEHFLIKKQEIIQVSKGRMLQVTYPNHREYSQTVLPLSLIIEALQKKGKTNISINYNQVTFNEELSFPYSVPDAYERIFIN
ncbi:DUF4292 domain-containing protein [Flavobacterium sp.]|uniref:DUF4292 domain-containing protein n=1 Tax=Flavobacterium sp. TaxID=239 RepID=UPI002B4B221C|nr:DUF4292 domain-containing protein [Flavobacterium sp.]HLF52452.1 DUF4292 domain-containing protein [Flavobacterium sp.]